MKFLLEGPIDNKSALVQVMAWCRQATSHCPRQCCPRSMSPYGVTRPQWVNTGSLTPVLHEQTVESWKMQETLIKNIILWLLQNSGHMLTRTIWTGRHIHVIAFFIYMEAIISMAVESETFLDITEHNAISTTKCLKTISCLYLQRNKCDFWL